MKRLAFFLLCWCLLFSPYSVAAEEKVLTRAEAEQVLKNLSELSQLNNEQKALIAELKEALAGSTTELKVQAETLDGLKKESSTAKSELETLRTSLIEAASSYQRQSESYRKQLREEKIKEYVLGVGCILMTGAAISAVISK